MNGNKKLNFAVIGYGHIGKRHAEMIKRNPESSLVAVVDLKSREELNLEEDIPLFHSLDDFFAANVACDIVNIATPNGLHAPMALKCLDNKKHVVIEKPMSLSKADAEKVIYKSLNVHKHVFVVMQNRYSPPSLWIKEMLNSGVLGNIYMVQLNCYWNRDSRYYVSGGWHGTKDLDGGTLFTQFSHFIDILYWLFGDIEKIHARLMNHNHASLTEFEDSGFVSFDFINGGSGCINYSTSIWNSNLESSMTIIAENGSIKIGGQYMDKVEICHVKDYNMPELAPTNPGNDYGTYKGSAQNHHYVVENVVNVLKGRTSITTNALEGLKVIEIIERIYHAGNYIAK